MRKILSYSFLLGLSFLFPSFLLAAGVSISPSSLEISSIRGGTKNLYFDITNQSKEDNLNFKIYLTDMDIDRQGDVQFLEIGKGFRSCVEWIRLKNNEVSLAPQETQKIIFRIAVPAKAASGGYYGVIMCDLVNKDEQIKKTSRRSGLSFAVFVRITVYGGKIEKRLEVEEFSFDTMLDKEEGKEDNKEEKSEDKDNFSKLYFKIALKNKGNIHLRPEGKLIIFTQDRRRIGEGKFNSGTIFPEHTRDFIILYDKPLLEGDYLARATFRYKGQKPLVKEIPLSIKAQSGQKGLGDGNQLTISSLNTPKELRIKAVSGAFRSKGFTVRNQKREPLEVGVSLEGEAASWSKIEPRSLRIESAKSKRVLLTVNVPDGTAKGNYLGKIKLLPALAGENSTQGLEPQEVEVIIEVREF